MSASSLTVDILLATYNGADFLAAQLDSIAGQRHANWRLTVRDDGSDDATGAILAEFAQRFPGRVHTLVRDVPAAPVNSPSANFAALIDAAEADYIMFADQDDVWLPSKVGMMLREMRELEARHVGAPILVHSDLAVVDAALTPVAPSFWAHMRLNPRCGRRFERLMLENCVTGCALMVNRRLVELARPIPSNAIMHDWWLALVASAFGVIGTLDEPTVLYRQHGRNAVGAQPADLRSVSRNGLHLSWQGMRASLERKRTQVRSLVERYRTSLPPDLLQIATEFVALPQSPWGIRQWKALRQGLRMSTATRSIGLYLSL